MIKKISKKADYVAEALALLGHLGIEERYCEIRESLSKKSPGSFKDKNSPFPLLEQIEEKAKFVLKDEFEQIKYYFSGNNDTGDCIGRLALLWDDSLRPYYPDLKSLSDSLTGLSEMEFCRKFGRILQKYGNLIQEDLKESAFEITEEPIQVISYLMKMELSDEERWKIQTVFMDPETHQKNLLNLLEKTLHLLDSFDSDLTEQLQRFYHYWNKKTDQINFYTYLEETLDIHIGENPLGYRICPRIFRPNVASFFSDTDNKGNYKQPDLFKMGILFGDDYDLKLFFTDGESGFEEYALRVLKMLSDKSKFEILSYIRDKSAYGSELADYLNLTTATISHHMNALLECGLVEIKKENNRIYYRANPKTLEEVLKYSQNTLIGKLPMKE